MALAARTLKSRVTVLAGAEVVYAPTGEGGIFREAVRVTSDGAVGLVRLFKSSELFDAADFGLEVIELEESA